ncbi:MAG: SpoIID/LytB domain-containing protein [Firmicutes bacterium]|nr:SpoIID/LytB domain-containing protein [Bacillota bacterium]
MADNRRKTLTWVGVGIIAVIAVIFGVLKSKEAALGKEPAIKVYIADKKQVLELPMEEYVAAVIGGEMKNYWPHEALAAQAIVARTFALKALEEHRGTGPMGSDIQAGFKEAQEYKPENVNKAIRGAIKKTRGKVLTENGKLINAWFHSNSGGKTALAKEGLNLKDPEPAYTLVTDSPDDTEDVPLSDRRWEAEFSKGEIEAALKKTGLTVKNIDNISIAKRGPSERAETLTVHHTGGVATVGGNDLRVALDPMRMRSNLLTELEVIGDKVIMKGKGFGHGVGLSQWGAHNMAKAGKHHESICRHYFKNVKIEKRWV